jgi:hypothetical protein
MVLDQDEVIRRFINRYNACQDAQFTITRWPDKEERNQRACDAYAEALTVRPLAIEHTNIETFWRQKQDSARFVKVCGVLETELSAAFPYVVNLFIPMFGIQAGTDWNGIRDTLRKWLLTQVSALPFGHTNHQIEGVPFRIGIWKEDSRRRGFGVDRWAPQDLDTNDELTEIVVAALHNKNDQLQQYHANGDETILILESDDVPLGSTKEFYKAFLQASACVSIANINQVWLARTSHSPHPAADLCCFICFNGPDSILEKVNLQQWRFGKHHAPYWWAEIEREKEQRKVSNQP